jgi:hypothetical protein
MDKFANTILAQDFPAKKQFPNIRYEAGRNGALLVRDNSPRIGTENGPGMHDYQVAAVKKAFKRIRSENKNPRLLKKINRDYNKILAGKVDIGEVVRILGDYQVQIKAPRIVVERETKADVAAA